MNITKIIKGENGKLRKSRFHDEKGNLIPVSRLLRNGPKAFFSMLSLKIFSKRPVLPWLSYDAIANIKNFLNKEKIVLEFGSGMSTIWFAKNSKYVYSVEDYQPWYNKVKALIASKNIKNISYEHFVGDEYYNYMAQNNQLFDFILIDGFAREKCMRNAIKLIKPGGMIYLDNSDKDFNPAFAKDNTREAESILIDFAKKNNAKISYFEDFCPTAFFVQQGLMVKL